MTESKWLCTCKSVRNYYQHPTEVDSEGRCVHCKYYAITASKPKKRYAEPVDEINEFETSNLNKTDFDLNWEADSSEDSDELLEYDDEFKALEE